MKVGDIVNDFSLTSEEIALLTYYRNLSERHQGRVYQMVVYLTDKELQDNMQKNRERIHIIKSNLKGGVNNG